MLVPGIRALCSKTVLGSGCKNHNTIHMSCVTANICLNSNSLLRSRTENSVVKLNKRFPIKECNVANRSNSGETHAKDKIVTVPNLLCVSRIAAAPCLANFIVSGNFSWAAGLFVYAAVTDFADGYIARNFKGQSSSLGSFLDPLADKILVATLYLSLTYVNLIPPSLTGLVVSRDLFLIYAGLYIRYMSVVPPFTLNKYFDVSLPTAQIQPTTISKVNTGFQFTLVAVTLGAPLWGYVNHPWLHYLWAVTGVTTFLSAVSYAFMKDTYKFSHKEYDHQFGKKLTAFILFVMFNIGFTYSFPSQNTEAEAGGDQECPVTGQKTKTDPYMERTARYYEKQASLYKMYQSQIKQS